MKKNHILKKLSENSDIKIYEEERINKKSVEK